MKIQIKSITYITYDDNAKLFGNQSELEKHIPKIRTNVTISCGIIGGKEGRNVDHNTFIAILNDEETDQFNKICNQAINRTLKEIGSIEV